MVERILTSYNKESYREKNSFSPTSSNYLPLIHWQQPTLCTQPEGVEQHLSYDPLSGTITTTWASQQQKKHANQTFRKRLATAAELQKRDEQLDAALDRIGGGPYLGPDGPWWWSQKGGWLSDYKAVGLEGCLGWLEGEVNFLVGRNLFLFFFDMES